MDTRHKCTLYSNGMFGVSAIEIYLIDHGTRKYAQYGNAPYVRYRQPRQRKDRGFQASYDPWILILEGWGHIRPKTMTDPEESSTGMTVTKSLYALCDPRYATDADTMIDAYIDTTKTKVIADYRHTKGFNSCRA